MRMLYSVLFCLLLLASSAQATFSIVAYDPDTKSWGVAVQSKFFGVGSVVPWAKAGVGAVATQSFANTRYGPDGLAMMADGGAASNVVAELTEADPMRSRRQLGVVDAKGDAAAYTGTRCMDWAGQLVGTNYCVQGNILASGLVVTNMATAFEKARASGKGELADWLVAALVAGQEAGGDVRGKQSAALLVVKKDGGYAGLNDRFVDVRVEDHETPIKELERLLKVHKTFYPRR